MQLLCLIQKLYYLLLKSLNDTNVLKKQKHMLLDIVVAYLVETFDIFRT